MDGWANDVARIFGESYIGLVTNSDTGRQLFKADLVALANQYQSIDAISNFKSDDITVNRGDGKRDVAVDCALQPNDSMEKLYMDRAFPDTESGDDLTKKVRERSIFRTPATAAIRKGYFEDGNGAAMDVPIGTRFSGDNLNYTVTEKIATGQFRLLCETPGAAGNQYQGNLFPIDYVEGLGAARLADILINGEDEESDENLLDRYMDSLQAQAYGGNKADYKTKVELLQGVGAVKVFPVWNGGGTVKIVFVNSDWGIPSSDLVNSVQTVVDPVQNQGVGDGIAPIGHVVTVEGVTGTTINVSFTLTFSGSATWSTVETSVKKAIQDYFDSLAKTWDEQENLVVRVSQIETKVLNVEGVIDITGTKINGGTQNISLASNAIPVLGVVTNGS